MMGGVAGFRPGSCSARLETVVEQAARILQQVAG